jgi:sarcosine oxidase subunit beta
VPPSDSADVVIIGAGVSGLSTARALVELGVHDVVVIDRAAIGSGGSGKSSGIVRCHYGVRSLAAMAWHALPILADAQEILGADSGYHKTGYLVGVGPENVEALHANVAMHQDLGIEVDLVDHDAAQEMWPWASMSEFAGFAYEPRGGYGDGHQTAQAFWEAARRSGARIRQYSQVVDIILSGSRTIGVRLRNGERIACGHVVVAAGPWSVPLADGIGIDLPIRAQRAQILLIDPGMPVCGAPVFSDLVSLQYFRTEGSSSLLVGDSDHTNPEWSDPDLYRERATDDELSTMIPKIEHRLTGIADARLTSSYAGCYDVTPDYNPIISASPIGGLWLCAGFSGHGYKISPSVGELMADLMTAGRSRHGDIDHHDFKWERFATNEPLVSPHPYAGAGQMR